jgi:uncharacterized membrane protein
VELKARSDDGGAVQRHYARWLRRGAWVGVAVLSAGFAAYLLGVAPHVPMDQLAALWERPASEYLRHASLRPGWSWAALVHRTDMLVVAGVALLASCSIVSLVAAIYAFRENGERTFAIICAVQIAVLVLAASGLLSVGH